MASNDTTANKDAVNNENVNPEQLFSGKMFSYRREILLRTSAVRVFNPTTGKSTLGYAQHDTASLASLISERLKDELNLDVKPDNVIIRKLTEATTKCGGLTEFNLQTLFDNEVHSLKNALVALDFVEEKMVFSHIRIRFLAYSTWEA